MNKKSLVDIDVAGKRVLMRADFNVPLEGGAVSDDTRIRAALPTIKHILDHGASLVLMSHLGRPKGKVNPEFTLAPVAARLSELLGKPITFADDCVGAEVEAQAQQLQAGEVLLLENLRFHAEEEGKASVTDDASADDIAAAKADMKARQRTFSEQLARLGDVYVDDAFGTAHRAHASMAGVTEFMQESVSGFLLEKEIQYLGKAIEAPERPFVAILGGAKISGKIDVILNLIDKVDTVIVGGGLVYTMYKAMGLNIGDSLLEEDRVELAGEILKRFETSRAKLLMPLDHVVADGFSETANTQIVDRENIPDGWEGLDIGPKSIALFGEELRKAKTVLWNGPLGCFEMAPFAAGTMSIAKAIAETDCVSIVGGGDSISAINKSGLSDHFSHLSTGGGASLEFLEGKALPGVVALSDR
ncbi:MAG: phosphoglycerate kinase [Kiritimatiellae bacterium]|nr:phosphoglycerate kinase [Kiritimatiellia bacterium]